MSEPGPPQLPGFAARIGIELLSATAEEVVAELEPDDRHLGPAGDVHHGVYASLVETTASVGAWLAVEDRGQQVVGIANATETLLAPPRPAAGPPVPSTSASASNSGRRRYAAPATTRWSPAARSDCGTSRPSGGMRST